MKCWPILIGIRSFSTKLENCREGRPRWRYKFRSIKSPKLCGRLWRPRVIWPRSELLAQRRDLKVNFSQVYGPRLRFCTRSGIRNPSYCLYPKPNVPHGEYNHGKRDGSRREDPEVARSCKLGLFGVKLKEIHAEEGLSCQLVGKLVLLR